MKGEVFKPHELDRYLIDLWERFRDADPVYGSPFFSPLFTLAVAQVRDDARVAVLEQHGTVVGFLPFHLVRGTIGKPIGGHLNDYHGPIFARGAEVQPQALLKAAGLSAYDYSHLPCALDTFSAFTARARVLSRSPQMDLSGGYEACIARKDSSWTRAQRTMQRKWRKTEREIGRLSFAFHDPSDVAFRQHVAMKSARFADLRIVPRFASGWEGAVLETIRQAQEPDFAGVMSTLHAGDRLIAAHFGMRSKGTWHWWFPSYDLSLNTLSPGISLLDQCARAAEAHGLTTIDFGRGDERYKQLFADRSVYLCEGSIARRGSSARRLRKASDGLSSLAGRLPLGRFDSYLRRAAARLISGTTLPDYR